MRSLKGLSRACNMVLFFIPSVILLGWATESSSLKLLFHMSGTAMNPMSAVCFLLLGAALLIADGNSNRVSRYTSAALALLPLSISTLHSSGFLSPSGIRLDQFLFTDQLNGNVMPLHTCIGFAIASLTVFVFRYRGKGAVTASPLLALAVGWLAMLAITGYFYGVDILHHKGSYSPMALSSAITFLFFAVSVLLAKSTYEPTRTFVSPSTAGRIARILIPLALTFPILSGWLRMTGEAYGIFDQKLGVTIFAVINIAVWASAIWTTAHNLFKAEERNKQLIKLLDRNSKTDLLSGVWNRRYLEQRLEAELAGADRHRRPLSCIITDIDFFKKVNDTYGHHVGDIVIKTVGQLLSATVRKEDIVCRYGGEEFVVLLPDTDESKATLLAERLRVAIEQTEIIADGKTLRVTCSFGVAQAEDASTAVVERADAALYSAKKSGRNRVVAASLAAAA